MSQTKILGEGGWAKQKMINIEVAVKAELA
jgi:hypothetical protein